MTLATRTLIGMGLGALAGLFFGERVAFLKVLGDAFIALLQMSVLPYVVTSLIGEVGRLRMKEAVSLGKSVGFALVLIWVITLGTNLAMPLAFPDWEQASFYSTSLVSEPAQFDFVEQYIPINVFNSLSSNIIPAVVVFCLAVGIILIRIEEAEKETLLSVLSVLSGTLASLTTEIAKLSPYGAFAIIASLSGTLRPEELQMLQVYIAAFIVISLILVFWTLPALLVTVSPVSYSQVFRSSRDALVTAFATGSLFVVIPLLARGARELFTESDRGDKAKTSVDIAVASSLSLPTAGKILTLSYVLFAGWLAGAPLHASNYISYSVTGLFSFFGSVYQAVPYLLDLYQIPADTFQFFPAINNLVNVRFGTLLAAVHTLTLAVLAGGTAIGIIRFKWRKILTYLVLTLLVSLAGPLLVRLVFENLLVKEYEGYELFVDMRLNEKGEAKNFVDSLPSPDPKPFGRSRLDWIKERKRVRIGYVRDALPFAYVNSRSELVGFDVEMAYVLARELGIRAEFVRVEVDRVQDLLSNGTIDLVMSGIAVTPERASDFAFSIPYMEKTLAFLVRDHRREEFSSREAVKGLESPRIGTLDSPYLMGMLRGYLPQAELVIQESPRAFLRDEVEDMDAFLFSAESGSAWTLIYPSFSVAIPKPDVLALPVAWATSYGDEEFLNFLDTWITLKKSDGTVQRLYEHWILGESEKAQPKRWSLLDTWLSTPVHKHPSEPIE